VYWIAGDSAGLYGTINKAPIGGGSAITLATGQMAPASIAVDATGVYWTNMRGGVMRMPLAGGPAVVLGGGPQPYPLALDATHAYWAGVGNPGSVMKVPKAGGTSVVLVPTYYSGGPQGLCLDSSAVYWCAPDSVVKTSLTGTGGTVIAWQTKCHSIAVDSTHVYWTEGYGSDRRVMKVPRSGGGAVSVLASGQEYPSGLAIDQTHAYWIEEGRRRVMKVPLSGGLPVTIASMQRPGGGIAVDAENVYWTTDVFGRPGGLVRRHAK